MPGWSLAYPFNSTWNLFVDTNIFYGVLLIYHNFVFTPKKNLLTTILKKNAEEKNLKNWNKITKSGKKERDGIAKKIWKDREKNWKFQRKVNKKTRNEWIRLRINWYWSVECIRFHAKCTTSIWFDFGFVFVLDDNLYVVFNDDENILDKKMKKIV